MLIPESKKNEPLRLTDLSRGAGCGCKIAPAVLAEITQGKASLHLPELLVSHDHNDDAAVYQQGNDDALIATVDFFSPIVDEPFTYGQIAAANSLSDVYAMGGKPIVALAVLGWPVEKLPIDMAQQVMAGARQKCAEVNVLIAGGHTIDASEPFFGLSVTGQAPLQYIKRNNTARPGDLLYLTKPIGTGILATARKRGLINEQAMANAINLMCRLNSEGMRFGQLPYVHALTDVTGFGLLGHLLEMCTGAGLAAQLWYQKLPLLAGVQELCAQFVYADNTMRNWKAYEAKTHGTTSESLLTLCDPQTNGGLLAAVDANAQAMFENEFPEAVLIGEMMDGSVAVFVEHNK